ncbi:MAG: DNA cytosine methyltransferase [Eubacteriales bacterium]
MAEIEVFSFFAGLGFLDLGFHNAGFNISLVNEVNPDFIGAYKYSRDNLKILPPTYGYANCDIRDVLIEKKWGAIFNEAKQKSIIGFIGGPPCPDFSFGGRNEGGTGTNGILTQIYVDLIVEKQPHFFVLENVKGLVKTKKHNEFYQNLKAKTLANGYYLIESLENALEYGVPQYRDRLFLLGFNKRLFETAPDFSFHNIPKGQLSDLLNLPWPDQEIFIVDSIRECPDNIRNDLTVQYWFDKNDVANHQNAQDFFKPKSTTVKFQNIEEGNTHGKSFKRLHRWRFSPTAAYGNNEVHLHPYKPRRISVAEALAIQSLPSNFMIPEDLSLSTKFKMVGNGVPYLMSFKLAKGLMSWLQIHIH